MAKWHKSILVAIAVALTAVASGCGGGEKTPPDTWYPTKEEAIRRGLEQERIPSEHVISVEEIDGETLIFFHNQEAFGAASLSHGEQGYRWHRILPYIGREVSDGSQPYPSQTLTIVTGSGKSFRVVFGYAGESIVKRMNLYGDGAPQALPVHGSGWNYAVLRNPNAQVTLEPEL